MSQKQIKRSKKHTVKEILQSLTWSIENGALMILSPLTDEYVTINLEAIKPKDNGQTK